MAEIVAHTLARGIFTLDGVLTAAECDALIRTCEDLGFERATVTTHSGPLALPGVRNNDRVIWDDARYAAQIWQRIAAHIPDGAEGQPPVGLNERWRFYRYEPGQRFLKHRDGVVALPPRVVDGLLLPVARSQTTFLVYLNDDCDGGETAFFHDDGDEWLRVRPKTGTALCFTHDIRHEGCKVLDGRKYVLRSDILYKP